MILRKVNTLSVIKITPPPPHSVRVVELTNVAFGGVSIGDFDEVTNEVDELF